MSLLRSAVFSDSLALLLSMEEANPGILVDGVVACVMAPTNSSEWAKQPIYSLVASFRSSLAKGIHCFVVAFALAGCGQNEETWPPPPRNKQEQLLIDSARRAVTQFDGWSDVAWVVERQGRQWRVQAWQIVHPAAKGKLRCVPWAVRGIVLDDEGKVLEYRNHL